MNAGDQCNRCLAGTMRVVKTKKSKTPKPETLECDKCGRGEAPDATRTDTK